jgi:hypothetical protein
MAYKTRCQLIRRRDKDGRDFTFTPLLASAPKKIGASAFTYVLTSGIRSEDRRELDERGFLSLDYSDVWQAHSRSFTS